MLGRLEVVANGVDLTPVRPKQLTALGLLLLRANEVVSSDELVDALWGERPPETAQTALHGHISALRKRLGADRIETRPPGYLLRVGSEDEIDVRHFERLTAEAYLNGPLLRAEKLREALALFRGEPLVDFTDDSFARSESHRLRELRLDASEEQIEADLQLGRHVQTLPELERLIVEQPHRERLRGQLMVALYRAGRQGEALAAFGDGRRVLVDELGIEPSRALRELERRILNQDAALADPDVFAPTPPTAAAKPFRIVTFLSVRGGEGELIRTVVGQHGGTELEAYENSLVASFARARDAVGAAVGIQRATRSAVRIGIHSADAPAADDDLAIVAGARGAASIRAATHDGQILLSETTLDLLRETPLDDAAIRDLGEHRLSDLAPARRLFQLLAPGLTSDFPPPLDLEERATNLPIHTSPFVGREREIRELVALLTQPAGSRLVTLTGPGGTGKTRLATHVAAELLEEFADGVFFIELAALTDARLVLPTVALTLGLAETAGTAALERIVLHLRGRRVLLVLDNAEHLLTAAGEVAELTQASAGVRVLVTSRVPPPLPAQTTYAVAPLATRAGVALFASRARALRLDFELTSANTDAVAGICFALDGLPLAIELAAARINVLPPAALLKRLDRRLQLLTSRAPDVTARHRGLRAAIDWSYDLLDPEEQRLFARLAIFAGGCTLDAAEHVCGDNLDVIDGLAALVDANLVRLEGTDDEPRFVMLETIREYAAEQLAESDDGEELKRRHAAHFLTLAEEAEPHLRERPGEWLELLEHEHTNLRAALDRFSAAAGDDIAMRLAGSLWRFWYLKIHLTEGRQRLEDVLANDARRTPARAKALLGAAVMAGNCGDVATAVQRAEEALVLSSELDDTWSAAYAGFMLGGALMNDDSTRAGHLLEESAQAFEELGDYHSMLLARRNLARIAEELDVLHARSLHEENLRIARETANPRIEASTLGALATIALDEGRVDDGLAMLAESLRLHQGLRDSLDTATDLCRTAVALTHARKPAAAVQILASFDALRQDVGAHATSLAAMNDATLSAIRAQLDTAAVAEAWEQGRHLTSEEALAFALSKLSGGHTIEGR
jgi:predicted ATPase/DNA-binding SARP family transcriptional activator